MLVAGRRRGRRLRVHLVEGRSLSRSDHPVGRQRRRRFGTVAVVVVDVVPESAKEEGKSKISGLIITPYPVLLAKSSFFLPHWSIPLSYLPYICFQFLFPNGSVFGRTFVNIFVTEVCILANVIEIDFD